MPAGTGRPYNKDVRALAAAKKRGYKGISSDPTMRSDVASAVWQSLARGGTVRKVGSFDVLES